MNSRKEKTNDITGTTYTHSADYYYFSALNFQRRVWQAWIGLTGAMLQLALADIFGCSGENTGHSGASHRKLGSSFRHHTGGGCIQLNNAGAGRHYCRKCKHLFY
jgi:hypothetical protein